MATGDRPAGPAAGGRTLGDVASSDVPSAPYEQPLEELVPEAERYERAAAGTDDPWDKAFYEKRARQLRASHDRRSDRLPPEMEADLEAQRVHEELYRETLRPVVKSTDHSYACNQPRRDMRCGYDCDCACHRECPDLLKAQQAFYDDPMTDAVGMGSEMSGVVTRAHVKNHQCQGYGVE